MRIVHSLDRFSEDLDFSTKRVEQNFDLDEYLTRVMDVMSPYGFGLTVDDKDLGDRNVQTRFLKDVIQLKKCLLLNIDKMKDKIKIKVEVDTSPPLGANHKVEYVDFPDDFQIKAYDLSSLMAVSYTPYSVAHILRVEIGMISLGILKIIVPPI